MMEKQGYKTVRVVIWGSGSIAERFVKQLDPRLYKIMLFIDNNQDRQGKKLDGWDVVPPDFLKQGNVIYDRLILCVSGWRQVYRQAVETLNVPEYKIENGFLFHKQKLLQYYGQQGHFLDDEAKQIIHYLEKSPMDVFNYEFTNRYREDDIDVMRDQENGLFYIFFQGKKLYMSRKFRQEYQVRMYCNQLFMEQDQESPHCYLGDGYQVERGSVVLDAGAAEGNFALSVIDKVDKIFLVEHDKDWIEALKHTFSPYDDKVVYVNRFLSDRVNEKMITIDELSKINRINFIKMDIEGSEIQALNGASQCLGKQSPCLEICAYHNPEDGDRIVKIIEQHGYHVSFSKGYMINIHGGNMEDFGTRKLVRGIVRGYKQRLGMEV